MSNTLTALEAEIRELINRSEFLWNTLNQQQQLSLLWSALDIINDTEVGIGEYTALSEAHKNDGSYLLIFGVLQLLQVQQDAVKYLCETVDIAYPESEETLVTIREIRNSATGHPVLRKLKDPQSKKITDASYLMVRATMRAKSFTLYRYHSQGAGLIQTEVDLPDLIRRQRYVLAGIMSKVLDKLKQQENEYRREHRSMTFERIFHGSSYVAQKLFEATITNDQIVNGSSLTQKISTVIDKFENEIRRRDLREHILDEIAPMRRALHQLKEYFDGGSCLIGYDARIYADYLKRQLENLIHVGREIDERFAVDE